MLVGFTAFPVCAYDMFMLLVLDDKLILSTMQRKAQQLTKVLTPNSQATGSGPKYSVPHELSLPQSGHHTVMISMCMAYRA